MANYLTGCCRNSSKLHIMIVNSKWETVKIKLISSDQSTVANWNS